ncbi:MAG TPA: hypothetical protein VKN36_09895 [Eudoraea sp.]|nr:hypothetical protein [Eudoraea sp.]
MRAFFEGLEDLFVNVLFWPYDFFRFMENWWSSNLINWIFVLLGFVAMVYWLMQLKNFNDRGEEDKNITAHSYL